MARIPKLELGDMPIQEINQALTELAPLIAGPVVMSAGAQIHASTRHPRDYARCLPHIGTVVSTPDFIGNDIRNPGKIELIKRVPTANVRILVAVKITKDRNNEYNVLSFYPVNERKIINRIRRGFLYPV